MPPTPSRLGTAVLVLPQRNPVVLAKQLASSSIGSPCRDHRHRGCRAPHTSSGPASDSVSARRRIRSGCCRGSSPPAPGDTDSRSHGRRTDEWIDRDGRLDDVLEDRSILRLTEQVGDVILRHVGRRRRPGRVDVERNEEADAAVDLGTLPRDELRSSARARAAGRQRLDGAHYRRAVVCRRAASVLPDSDGSSSVNGDDSKMTV